MSHGNLAALWGPFVLVMACNGASGHGGAPDFSEISDTSSPAIDDTSSIADRDGDGWTQEDGDCDDMDGAVFPGNDEWCDEKDNDCDGLVDDEDPDLPVQGYVDADGDGFDGTESATCGAGSDLVDCDDSDPSIFPGAEELYCDGVDQNCDGGEADGEAAFNSDQGVTYSSIQDALDDAEDGDSIRVCPGTWPGGLSIGGTDHLDFGSYSGSAVDTVFDAEGKGRVLQVKGAEDLVISGITFRNGDATTEELTWAGCMYVDDSRVTVKASAFEDCVASQGGAIYVNNVYKQPEGLPPLLRVEDSEFRGNQAGNGGAIRISGDFAVLEVSGSRFEDNVQTDAYANGGGIYVVLGRGGSAIIEDSTFTNNVGGEGGGGLYVQFQNTSSQEEASLIVDSCTFEYNTAGEDGGGGVDIRGNSDGHLDVAVSDSHFYGNEARPCDSYDIGCPGAGLHIEQPLLWSSGSTVSTRIVDSIFEANEGPSAIYVPLSDPEDSLSMEGVSITDHINPWASYVSEDVALALLYKSSEPSVVLDDVEMLRNDTVYAMAISDQWAEAGWADWSFDATQVSFGIGLDENRGDRDLRECEEQVRLGVVNSQVYRDEPCP